MTAAVRYPFVERDPRSGAASLAPMLPLTLAGANSAADSGRAKLTLDGSVP